MAKKLEIKKATIHFIYSFLPSTNTMSLSKDSIKKIYNLKDELPGSEGGGGKPDARTGITSYIELDIVMGFLQLKELKGKLGNIDITVKPLVRIFPLGGTCCFSVSASTKSGGKEGIDTNDVHEILHLVSQNKNKATGYEIINIKSEYYKFEKEKTSLFNLFRFIMDDIAEKFNAKEEEDKKISDNEKEELKFLCRKHLRKGVEEPNAPWVVSVLELKDNSDSYNAFCGSFSESSDPLAEKTQTIGAYNQEIAPLLYKSPKGTDFQTEPAYINPPIYARKVGFYNMNVDSRLYVHMSKRSILCICSDESKVPAQYFLPVLFDLCEMTHSRWHTLIILNKILDDNLKNFVDPNMEAKERIHKILGCVNQFTSCLEDPTTYVVSGDALRKIHEKLIDTYRLKGLTDVVLKKVDMLEKTYKYRLDLSWAEE